MKETDIAKIFFEDFAEGSLQNFVELPQSGSSRKNFIGVFNDEKFVITYNENLLENEAFFYFSDVFSGLKLNTPKIFKINSERNLYIQEFLGNETLFEIILKEGETEKVRELARKTIKNLFHLQNITKEKINFSKCFEYEKYDELPIIHDLYYFKNFLVDVLEISYHKSTLLKEFKKISRKIENLSPRSLMIRDFQARNILVNNNEVYFIDYQSAMHGPAMYDVVSFLYQAKANFSENFKHEMLEYYFSFYENREKQNLEESLIYCKLIRFVQVLGAYGFRGIIQRKSHFIESLNQGILNLLDFSQNNQEINEFPELKKLIQKLSSEETKIKIQEIINKK